MPLFQVSSLGSGPDHVMDAISECEQIDRARNIPEEKSRWMLYFRKEIFTPWHDASYDDVGTSLIYLQIARGIRIAEYRTAGVSGKSRNHSFTFLQFCFRIK